ncbi:TetR/AcrR family transcriptional regulator [Kitasatospora sp. P5_F3]
MTNPPAQPAPPTKALRRDAAENRKRLLRAAWEVFAEVGPDAGVEEIARRAGVGMGTLYRRFPTKDALVEALSDEILDAVLDNTRRVASAQTPGHGLEDALWYIGSVMASHHGGLSRLWQVSPPGADGRRDELWALLGQLLEEARTSGEVRDDLTLTDVYLCVLAMRSLVDDTQRLAPESWRRFLSFALAGFSPAEQPLAYRPADDSLIHAGTPARPPRA